MSTAHVLIVESSTLASAVAKALSADGYRVSVVRSVDEARTVLAVRQQTWVRGEVSLNLTSRKAKHKDREVDLTSREWAIVTVLIQDDGNVVTHARLLEQVWGRVTASNQSSLEVIVSRIRRKLGQALIRTVRGEGYAILE